MIFKPIFLMAVLVFGLIGNPFAFSNFDNKVESSILGFDFSRSGGLVFAQTEDDEDESENEGESNDQAEDEEQEAEIDVEVKKGKAKVMVEFDGEKSRFVLETTDESEIIAAIEDITGLTEDQIKAIWEFETEEEDEELSDVDEEKTSEKMLRKESKVKQEAQDRIAELEQKIEQLEQRLQTLLETLESGKYFGPVVGTESVPKSYGLSFDGTVSSLNDSETADVSGEIFIETLGSLEDTSKFRVTGGEIVVGDIFYDFVFGKARITSSGQSDQKDSMTIIGQIISDEGDVNTIRISLDSTMPLEGDFGLEPIDVEIIAPQSKISNQWMLDASGKLSLLET